MKAPSAANAMPIAVPTARVRRARIGIDVMRRAMRHDHTTWRERVEPGNGLIHHLARPAFCAGPDGDAPRGRRPDHPREGPAVMTAQDLVERVLRTTRTWAVVGCSPDPWRDSHRIAALLQRHGYRVIPVNPGCDEVLGERCYASVGDIPAAEGVEVIDVFRRSAAATAHVDEAVAIGARAVWLQLGVFADADAVERARSAGLAVVEQHCPAIELPGLSSR